MPMPATTHSTQIVTPFGSGYVLEQRADQMHRHLPTAERGDRMNFNDILTRLRSALSPKTVHAR